MNSRKGFVVLTRYAMLVIGAASSWLCAWGEKPAEAQAEFPVSENLRGHEEIEWSVSYGYGLTGKESTLPRVLLIGDSICRAYEADVRERLKGRMNVTYWASSYCVTSPGYLKLLDFYLSETRYEVIHFNNGLHSLGTRDSDWEKGLRRALSLIRERQPQAKIIWATSTPLRDKARSEKVERLNAAADKVVRELGGIGRNDLYGKMDSLDRAKEWRDMFHFQQNAIKIQAHGIASACLNSVSMAGDERGNPTEKVGR